MDRVLLYRCHQNQIILKCHSAGNLFTIQSFSVRKKKKKTAKRWILSPCLLNLYAESIMRNSGLDEAQTGIKIAGRIINNFRYADEATLMAESKEELKSLLIKVKEESGKSWLKTQHSENKHHGIWSHHFMGNRWGNSGNSDKLYYWRLQNHCRWWLQPWN